MIYKYNILYIFNIIILYLTGVSLKFSFNYNNG